MLLELAAHLESKAAQLKWEGLSKIKVALSRTDTSSLTRLLEGCFGSVDPSPPSPSASTEITEPPEEHPIEEAPGSESSSPIAGSSISTAELVFPMKSIPLVITGIPEAILPLHGPETLSCYRCQFPDCTQVCSQKASVCNHIHCDHLNVALACIYGSGNKNPKMHWYSASAWERHVQKCTQENLPIFSNDLAFVNLPPEAVPCTSGSTSDPLSADIIFQRAKYLEEEVAKVTPSKCPTKQGPIKSSKTCKDKYVSWAYLSNHMISLYMFSYSRTHLYP